MSEDAPIYEDWEVECMMDDHMREVYWENTIADMEPIELVDGECPF